MKSPLHQLNYPTLSGLARAFETGRLRLPCSAGAVSSYVPTVLASVISSELNRLASMGMTPPLMAQTLCLLARERELAQQKQDAVDLVWTGEEVLGTESRDTYVVVQELFKSAQSNVLVSSFALDEGTKSHHLFGVLAERMDSIPDLQVRMFLNVKRNHTDTTPESILLREFADRFRKKVWPGKRLPEVFYDPRSLAVTRGPKACLHAKCVVVDDTELLITSANFTEAAHERNIEAGVRVSNQVAAKAIRSQFEMLVTKGALLRVPGL